MKIWKAFAASMNVGLFLGIVGAVRGLENFRNIHGHHFFSSSESFSLACNCSNGFTSVIDDETNSTLIQSASDESNITEDKVTTINIYRGARTVDSTLVVEDNMLLNTSISIYSYDNNSRTLNISNVPHDVVYVCSCLHEYANERKWEWTRDVNYLYIANGSTEGIPNTSRCLLVTGVDGVLIAGFAIDLLCMFNKSINVTFQNSKGSTVFTREVDASECSKNGTGVGLCTYSLPNATMEINGTQLICLQEGERTGSRDLCSHVPALLVIPRFTVFLTSDSDAISEGGSVTFTCSSNVPVMTNVIEWQTNDDFQADFGLSENSGQSQLKISDIRWNSSTRHEIKVSCQMIFSENVFFSGELFVKQGSDRSTMLLNPENIFIVTIISTIVVVLTLLCILVVIVREYTSPPQHEKRDRSSSHQSTNVNEMSPLSRVDNHPRDQFEQQQRGGLQYDLRQYERDDHYHHSIPYEAGRQIEEDEEEYDYDYSDEVEPPRPWAQSNPGIYQNVKQNSIHF